MARTETPPHTSLAALNEHISALLKQDALLLSEEIALEKQQTIAVEPKPGESVASRTRHWLNGFAATTLLPTSKGERLWSIRLDRVGIASALSQLEIKRITLVGERDANLAADATPEHREDIRTTLIAEKEMRKAYERFAARPSGVRARLPLANLMARPALPWRNDPLGELRRAAIQAGIVTKAEVE